MKAVVAALAYDRQLLLFRNNVGLAEYSGGAKVRYGLQTGSADLVGLLAPSGRFVALELKVAGRKPTAEQLAWLASIRRLGGFACVVTSVREAIAAIDRAHAGASE